MTLFRLSQERLTLAVALLVATSLLCVCYASSFAQSVDPQTALPLPQGFGKDLAPNAVQDQRVRQYLYPKRIVWTSEQGVANPELLLQPVLGQTSTSIMGDQTQACVLSKGGAFILDFGCEIHGSFRVEARDLTPGASSQGRSVKLRVRFGESVDEACAEVGEKGAINEHSTRDQVIAVPWLGAVECGESAFRFVRVDLVDDDARILFDSARAIFIYRDLPRLGQFNSSDERLNQVWDVAARTQLLTMQQYVFEGAKRDRLVWYGDFTPQTMTALRVYGDSKVLRDTLGYYARETWPLPKWMNGMPNYSLWWLITIGDLYRHTGDRALVEEQWDYVKGLVEQLLPYIKEDGHAGFPNPFLDWPTNDKPQALDAGTHAMFALGFDRVAEMAAVVEDAKTEKLARETAAKVRTYKPSNVGNKQAAALLALAGIEKSGESNVDVVAKNGAENFSTFYGYYMLEALSEGGADQVALDVCRDYWGAMIDVGATTFWEDFDLKWLENAGRIDERTPEGKESLHGDRGAYCYIGLRHSLCHGWASGPAAWISAHVLGVTPTEPGFTKARVKPFLGDLDWVEGDVPTPYGQIHVRCDKNDDGSIKVQAVAPKEIELEIVQP
ncbi:MAG: alpha-L-rhamnosidase C-terminal domain-containing protein [Planctomycetia bacterium]|nr:alpha-L-rhamnosidase C-terminal domain-containing protein [Planctomycetia bacterium]